MKAIHKETTCDSKYGVYGAHRFFTLSYDDLVCLKYLTDESLRGKTRDFSTYIALLSEEGQLLYKAYLLEQLAQNIRERIAQYQPFYFDHILKAPYSYDFSEILKLAEQPRLSHEDYDVLIEELLPVE